MGNNKEIKFEKEARDLILEGINEICRAVAVTLGPKGKNVIIGSQSSRVTKDGVSVARAISFSDPYKKIGADIIKEVASNTCDATGDGTTTSVILARAIITNGLKHVESGVSPISLKKGLELGTKAVIENMKAMARPCTTEKDIRSIAIISANNDQELGEKVAEIMIKVGPQGVIDIQSSDTAETTISSIEGMKLDSGFISPYFVTDQSDFTSRLENPLILITDMQILSLERLIPILEIANKKGQPLFIIGSEIGGDALTGLVKNHIMGKLKTCAIKTPGHGINKLEILEDLAVLTGGVVLTDQKGIDFDNFGMNLFGSCERIITDKSSALIVGGKGGEVDRDSRIANIKETLKAAKTEGEKSQIKDRIARMENGVAVIKVGANSETELSEKKDRIEDSIGASSSAIEEGYVPGGGVALAKAAHEVTLTDDDPDIQIGINIIKLACQAPIRQIADNCNIDSGVVLNKVVETDLGYNALTDKYEDLILSGIIDPLKVVRICLENATSLASMFLTTDCVIVDSKEQ